VLVHRDFKKWEPSVKQLLDGNFGTVPSFVRDYVEPLIGTTYTMSIQKFLLGWTQCKDVEEIKSRLREHYDRHHATVRNAVPKNSFSSIDWAQGGSRYASSWKGCAERTTSVW
jgi:hypothetical protein